MDNILDAFYKNLSQLFLALAILLFLIALFMWLIRKMARRNSEVINKIFWIGIIFGVIFLLVSIFVITNKADNEMQTFLEDILLHFTAE